MPDDAVVMDTLAEITAVSIEHGSLEAREHMIARIAALVASDAPALSYLMNLGVATELGLSIDDAQGILVAIAPIVGTPRVVEAAGNMYRALGLAVAVAEAELEAELEAEEDEED